MEKQTINGKPIYIVSNHACALKAWYDVWETNGRNKINLVTFDKHTDTYWPCLRYAAAPADMKCEYDVKKVQEVLDPIKSNPSKSALLDLLNQGIVRNDEHITTAMYIGLINEAFICCDDTGVTNCDKCEAINTLYGKIHYMEEVYNHMRTIMLENADETSPFYLSSSQLKNISDSTIDKLILCGLNTKSDFILDIDLDYFTNIKVLKERTDFNAFKELVQKAKAITIATEEWHVNNNVETMQSEVGDELAFSWTYKDCLDEVMKIIKSALEP